MEISDQKRNLILAIVMTGGFVGTLSQNLLISALPSMMAEFAVSPTVGQWLTTIYILVLGMVTAITAYLINSFNTKTLFLSAMFLFLIGCVISIFVSSFTALLFSRVIQACGAGVLLPLAQVVALRIFPVRQHGKALGLIGIVVGAAPAVGPLLSGVLVDAFGWRSIFYLLIVVSLLVSVFALFFLFNVGEILKGRMDFFSCLLYGVGFCSLMIGVTNRESHGWISYFTIVPMLAGPICLYGFVRRQLRLPEPLLHIRILKNGTFAVATVLMMITYISMMSGTIRVPIYIQSVRGLPALISGTVLLPGTALIAFFSPATGHLFDKHGPRTIFILGMILLAVGTGAFAFFGNQASLVLVAAMYAVRMTGFAFLLMPMQAYGVSSLGGESLSHATAIMNSLRQMAGALGSSVLVAIMSAASADSAVIDIRGINVSFGVETGLIILAFLVVLRFVRYER